MKLTGALLCLVIGFAAVKAIAISGRASFNPTGISLGGLLSFPGIPGLNVPRRTTLGSQTTSPSSTVSPSGNSASPESSSSNSTSTESSGNDSTSTESSGSNNTSTESLGSDSTSTESSGSNSTSTESSSSTSANDSQTTNKTSQLRSPNLLDLFNIPSAMSLIPGLSSNGIPSIPQIPGLSSLVGNARIPGVDQALDEARNHVAQALSLGASFEVGLDQAIQDALASNDSSAALQTLVQTILNSYVNVAANCPLIVVGARVLQEGLRLAAEVARSAENIIFGTTVSSTTVSSTTVSTTMGG